LVLNAVYFKKKGNINMSISSMSIQTNSDKYVLYENGTETIIVSTSFIGIDSTEKVFSVKLVEENTTTAIEKTITITFYNEIQKIQIYS
jgi:hypothetical protein